MVSKLDYQTITSEFDSYRVLNTYGNALVIHRLSIYRHLYLFHFRESLHGTIAKMLDWFGFMAYQPILFI